MSTKTAAGVPEVDAATRRIIEELEAHPFLDPMNMTPPQMRAAFDAYYATIDMPPEPVAVSEDSFPGDAGPVRVRIYHPTGDRSRPLPVTVFYKGGGLVMGSLDSYSRICRRLCAASQSIVVSVDYRQPPEHKFPAAVEDCYAALRWVRAHAGGFGGDASRVAVAGDSGGGMLAVVVTHIAHDNGDAPIDFQVLIYPAVGDRTPDRGSMVEFAQGYVFSPDQTEWLYAQYLADPADRANPRVAPNLREDLSGLPDAYIVTAHFDIFRDQAEDYGHRLAAAGVPVEIRRYDTVIHGFINMGGEVPAAGEALDACGRQLAAAFARAGA